MTELADFFPTYLALLEAGDATALGALYTEDAVMTSTGGPTGDSWEVGRRQIVASLGLALHEFVIDSETPPPQAYHVRDDRLAARFATFRSTATPRAGGSPIVMTVDSTEVLALDPVAGWQYLVDQSRVVSVTTPPPRS